LKFNEEIIVEIAKGKSILLKFLNMTEPNEAGERAIFFLLNGQTRSISVRDKKAKTILITNQKVTSASQIGSPLKGSISKIFVKEGEEVERDAPLFVIEAMKMETTITAPKSAKISKIFLKERSLVDVDD
jgi:pyruvate carboxylase